MLNLTQLETLTSAGLVRRAQKSLGKSDVAWLSKGTALWDYRFEKYTGYVDLVIFEHSQCDCPAAGLCKHIVAAAISSINEHTTDETFTAPELNMESIFLDAGKAACRYVFRIWIKQWLMYFDEIHKPSTDSTDQDTPNLVTLNIKSDHCVLTWDKERAIIGSAEGISAITIESGENRDKLLAAALYAAYQGLNLNWPSWLVEESKTKQQNENVHSHELKEKLRQQLLVLATRGVHSILPVNMVEMISCVPNLKSAGESSLGSGVLSLAEWVERRSSNQGLDPTAKILEYITSLYAQCESTKSSERSESELFEKLNLLCLGGHKWVNSSGALGLSMVFLTDDGEVYSASLMRSQKDKGFSLKQAWLSKNMWDGSPINSQFQGQYFSLTDASLNHWQSLSLSSKTQFHRNQESPFSWKAIKEWQQLKLVNEYGYALLSVKRWLYCDFDEVKQELVIQIEDENKQVLIVRQKYSEYTENRIANLLENWSVQAQFLLVRHIPSESTHIFEPIALYHHEWVSLDFMKAEKARSSLLTRMMAKFKNNESKLVPVEDNLISLFSTLERELSEYPHCDQAELDRFTQRFESLGLHVVVNKLNLINGDAEQYLQLVHCIGALKKLSADWPICSL